jgi:hypothetical protein
MQEVENDLLAAYRAPGASKPVKPSPVSPSGIRLREYKAFVTESSRSSHLLIKRSLLKKPETVRALPYSALTNVVTDGYGFVFSLTFSLPLPFGTVTIDFRGEGMTPLVDAILRGTATEVQLFDPEKFIAPAEGDFDREADEWQGATVVKEITIADKHSGEEPTTRH